jgi:L-alanine-DL-glutamate epimerase-like enolase superfamily enzyme
MPLHLSYCPFRLLFRHPFATSHGVREGTDSIFIRLEEDGFTGHGEVTLPPYLKEKPQAVIDRLHRLAALRLPDSAALLKVLDDETLFGEGAPGARAGVHTALIDLLGKKGQRTARELLDLPEGGAAIALVTVAITPLAELEERLRELPASGALKVKVGHPGSADMLRRILELDGRRLFLDANQGLTRIEEALELAAVVGDRLLGLEQPFAVGKDALQRSLQQQVHTCVYGDESIQNGPDIELQKGAFNGVNIKLMKCGGLDRAKQMADRAETLGMQVMLGSMSESSLGCTAMAQLAGKAHLLDLDGPWLIRNDPFTGITLEQGRIRLPEGAGIGAGLKAELAFVPAAV